MAAAAGSLCRLLALLAAVAGVSQDASEAAREVAERAMEALERGHSEAGIADLFRAQQLAPKDADIANTLGFVLHGAGRMAEAVTALRRAAKVAPEDAAVHLNLGHAYVGRGRGGDREAAEAAFRKAMSLDPTGVEAPAELAQLLERYPDRALEAEEAFEEALARAAPGAPSAALAAGLGALLMRTKRRLSEAQVLLQRAGVDSEDPQVASQAWNMLGALRADDGKLHEARDCFAKAVLARPDFEDALENLARSASTGLAKAASSADRHGDRAGGEGAGGAGSLDPDVLAALTRHLKKEIKRSPGILTPRLRLASFLLEAGRHAEMAQALLPSRGRIKDAPQEEADARRALLGTGLLALERGGRAAEAENWSKAAVKAGVWPSEWQRPAAELLPGLRGKPWWEPVEEPPLACIAEALERRWTDVLAEFEAQGGAQDRVPKMDEMGGLVSPSLAPHDGSWTYAPIFQDLDGRCGTFDSQNTKGQQCNDEAYPQICETLLQAVDCTASRGKDLKLLDARFSVLQPGSHIKPHCGRTNARLVVHLAVTAPAIQGDPGRRPAAKLRAGCCETRAYQEGKAFIFDDSFSHEVTVDKAADGPRVVLIVHIGHPDLGAGQLGRPGLAAGDLEAAAGALGSLGAGGAEAA